jgi:hypothetical protein
MEDGLSYFYPVIFFLNDRSWEFPRDAARSDYMRST